MEEVRKRLDKFRPVADQRISKRGRGRKTNVSAPSSLIADAYNACYTEKGGFLQQKKSWANKGRGASPPFESATGAIRSTS